MHIQRKTKYMKEELTGQRDEKEESAIIIGNLNIPFLILDRRDSFEQLYLDT